jgi:molybdopterin converting factor small subunit
MRVTVRVSGQMRALLGAASLEISLPEGASVLDAVQQLAEGKHANVRATLLTDDGDIQRTLVVAVGSDQVTDATTQLLRDGDTVTILHPISGG